MSENARPARRVRSHRPVRRIGASVLQPGGIDITIYQKPRELAMGDFGPAGPWAQPTVWSAVTCHRFGQATCRRRGRKHVVIGASRYEAALLDRQVDQAAKAVTSHRTPNRARAASQLLRCAPGPSEVPR